MRATLYVELRTRVLIDAVPHTFNRLHVVRPLNDCSHIVASVPGGNGGLGGMSGK